ncbi:hypothetical protein I7I48_07357 [Histoplasma ohiense]|nr:hypothetical protein I7I48_07357 [Histoplasma ohiense (nom. inval.)]
MHTILDAHITRWDVRGVFSARCCMYEAVKNISGQQGNWLVWCVVVLMRLYFAVVGYTYTRVCVLVEVE